MTTPGTRAILTDVNGRPIPQYFNPAIGNYEALFGQNGAFSIGLLRPVSVVTFQSLATVPGVGVVFNVGSHLDLIIEISGTSTSRQIDFMGRGATLVNRPLMGMRLSDFALAVHTTANNEIWRFDITGLTAVLFPIVLVGGGNITITGTAVA